MISNIVIAAAIGVVALGLGLFLRLLLVRRLKKTILDGWIIQTLGIVIILLLLIVAAIIASFITDTGIMLNVLRVLEHRNEVQISDIFPVVGNIVGSIVIIVLALAVARTLMKLALRGLGESHLDINIRTLIGRIIFITIILLALFWILSIWQIGFDVSLASIGVFAAAFTFAIQDILKDLVAGFYILLEHPFHIGDIITVTNAGLPTRTGIVEDIQLRTTRMRITSGEQVAVPNSLIFGGVVVNNTYFTERRVVFTMAFAQEAYHQDETLKSIIDALKKCEQVMAKPEPEARVSNYASQHVTLKVLFWVGSEQITGVSKVMDALHAAFPDADLTLVETMMDV
jgi:small-conductance mechanosensitive channel